MPGKNGGLPPAKEPGAEGEKMKVETKFGDAEVSIESGKVAREAGGSVIVRRGETMILATATASNGKREGLEFVPRNGD